MAPSPAVVDIDGDDIAEIFLTFYRPPGEHVVSGYRLDGTQLPGFPRVLIQGTDLTALATMSWRPRVPRPTWGACG